MRLDILKAASTGEIENLQPVLESNEMKPLVRYDGDADPIAYWKTNSEDGHGRDILAIMTEILNSRFTKVVSEGGQEVYVWPYFAEWPVDKLSGSQEVELYRLISPSALKTMRKEGAYDYYRLGIGNDGTWHFFLKGQEQKK